MYAVSGINVWKKMFLQADKVHFPMIVRDVEFERRVALFPLSNEVCFVA